MAIKIKLEAVETELFCSSKWWRDPDLPADMEYPTAHATEDGEEFDYPLTFICQIDCADIAPWLSEEFPDCVNFFQIASGTAGLQFQDDGMLNLIYKPSDFETGKWKLVRGVM